MGDLWYPLEPKFNILKLDEPNKIGNAITLPTPVVSSISNWIAE